MTFPTKPDAAAKPDSDGIFWVKWADKEYVYDKKGNHIGEEWQIGEWELIRIEDGTIDCFATDEVINWNGDWHVVYVVGPQVEKPL